MASINTIVKRKQYLWLGIVVVGAASAIGGALYLSDVDNRQGWTDAINNAVQKGTAHDVLEPKADREVMNAERLFSTARELRDVAAGRAVLRQAGLGWPCDDGADRWSGVVCRKIITPFLARGFFPDVLCLSSGCAGRSGAVTGVVSLATRG